MSKEPKKVIMYESDEAAVYKDEIIVSGWVGVDGKVYPEEYMARYANSTHKKCPDCSEVMETRSYCHLCREVKSQERFQNMEIIKDWDFPICIYESDEYLFDWDGVHSYCDINVVNPSELKLVNTVRASFSELDWDFFDEQLADDHDQNDLPEEVIGAVEGLNEVLRNALPNCWYASTKRIILEDDDENMV